MKQDDATRMWYEIDDEKARAKVSQSLREKSKDEKKRKSSAQTSSVQANKHSKQASVFQKKALSKSDVEDAVQLAIRSLGYSVQNIELTFAEAGFTSQALSALVTIFNTRYAIELTSESILNQSIHALTEQLYSMISLKNEDDLPPLAPIQTNIDTLAAAANAIKTPLKLDGAKPSTDQGTTKEAEPLPSRVVISDENLKPPAIIKKANKWQPSEDAQLRQQVNALGLQWTKIAENMTNRNARQCRERWVHHLRPGIKKGNWTAKEDEQIRNLHAKYGNSWHRIASEMEGRSDNAIKNRWYSWRRSGDHEIDIGQSDMSSQEEVASMTLMQLRESPLTLPELPEIGPPQTIQVRSGEKKRKVSDDSGTSAIESFHPKKKMLLSFDDNAAF